MVFKEPTFKVHGLMDELFLIEWPNFSLYRWTLEAQYFMFTLGRADKTEKRIKVSQSFELVQIFNQS